MIQDRINVQIVMLNAKHVSVLQKLNACLVTIIGLLAVQLVFV